MPQPEQIHIDIVSDVVCPWCAIGYRQLERAVAMMGDKVEVSVRWHPFQLAPEMPPEGKNIADYMRERYGATPEQGGVNRKRIVEMAASLGLEFNYSPESRMYNTFRAHQLLAWAGQSGKQTALKLALFRANFTEQRNVSDTDVLLDAAESAGLDREEARAALHEPAYARQVEEQQAYWIDQNVTGVPAFFVNGKYLIPGAQEAEAWVAALYRIIAKVAAQHSQNID